MSASLVGSEMCIRDSPRGRCPSSPDRPNGPLRDKFGVPLSRGRRQRHDACLLYTSDAADDM
eukprot:14740504-Alexandrium_andersonii.AAC.1